MERGLVCLLCGVLATSCSYAFVRPPPSDHPTAADDCTDSRVPPALDTAYTGLTALLLLIIVPRCLDTTGYNQDGTPAEGCTVGQWVGGVAWTTVVGTATAISAVHGWRATSSCRDRRALEQPIARTY
jgi:hypothetical protein